MRHFDNDMDELFNKAGEDYPLNTDKKNWDAVHRALISEQSPIGNEKTTNRYLRFLPLMLLLLVPVVFLLTDEPRTSNLNTADQIKSERPANDDKGSLTTTRVRTGSAPAANNNNKKSNSSNNDRELKQQGQAQISTDDAVGVQNSGTIVNDASVNDASKKRSIRNTASAFETNHNPASGDIAAPENTSANSGLPTGITKASQDPHLKTSLISADQPSRLTSRTLLVALETPKFQSPAFEVSPVDRFPGKSNETTPQKIQIREKSNRKNTFYYGIKAGPDLSTIRSQRVEKVGYSAGIAAGYFFSNRISLEVAGLWSRKKYYTEGKYFDKTRAHIPANVYIHYLDGGCDMIEIPVTARYMFSLSPNSFFVSAGFNSYLMNKEEYEYEADAGTGIYSGYRTYKRSGNHFASTFQLSGGYEFSIFNKTSLRIEPYLQLPLKSVGIGRMPITSAGVHFGLLRRTR
jgi:hypothetical protein